MSTKQSRAIAGNRNMNDLNHINLHKKIFLEILHVCCFEFLTAYFCHSEELPIWKSKSDDHNYISNQLCYFKLFKFRYAVSSRVLSDSFPSHGLQCVRLPCPSLSPGDCSNSWPLSLCCCCCCYVASVVSDCVQPHRQQPTRLLCPWDSLGKNIGVSCHFLLQCMHAC